MKRLVLMAVGLALTAAPPVAAPACRRARPTASARTRPLFESADGIHVVSQSRLDSRLVALTVSTSALSGSANIRVLLPTAYASHPKRRYPVLYLLHGTSGGAADWTTKGDAEQTTAGRPLIVVMPDIGQHYDGGGWCADWYNGGRFGRPQWERFHIYQLIPWIDHNLRTIASRDGRAIAGLSQGGFCALSYAARHPDLFSAALSFSGAPDIAYNDAAQALVTPIINGTELALDDVPANSIFGPRSTQEINWAAHDPTTLAANLRGMRLWLYTGNGKPGPFDSTPNSVAEAIEAGVEKLTIMFHDRLQVLGIPSTFDDYGPGTHAWPYWARDLRWSLGPLMAGFAHPPALPNTISYMSADPAYRVFGWRVTVSRKVREFSALDVANRDGFTITGSGHATVVTPSFYRPGAEYRVYIDTRKFGEAGAARADRHGRLTFHIALGPSNTVQEYPNDGPPVATRVYRTRVRIAQILLSH